MSDVVLDYCAALLRQGWKISEVENMDFPFFLRLQARSARNKAAAEEAEVTTIEQVRW